MSVSVLLSTASDSMHSSPLVVSLVISPSLIGFNISCNNSEPVSMRREEEEEEVVVVVG